MRRTDHHLVQDVLDGNVSRETFEQFQERLRKEPELVELYKGYALVHHTLHEEFDGRPVTDSKTPGSGCRPWLLLPILLLAVGLVAALLLVTKPWTAWFKTETAALATFSLDAVWNTEGMTHKEGIATGMTEGSILHLAMGRSAIHLAPSVIAIAEGPATLKFDATEEIHLLSGNLFLNAEGSRKTMTLVTPNCRVSGQNADIAIRHTDSGDTEVLLLKGYARMELNGANASTPLLPGKAVRIDRNLSISPSEIDESKFAKSLGRYRNLPLDVHSSTAWYVDHGPPAFSLDRIEGSNYAIYQKIPPPESTTQPAVWLLTTAVGKPLSGNFHTDGWAGISLYQNGWEHVFFGDPYGPDPVWALDIKQNQPLIQSDPPLSGPATVTLRYDARSGAISLHPGGLPLKPAICSGSIAPNLRFDQIRVAASIGASLTLNNLQIRVGSDPVAATRKN